MSPGNDDPPPLLSMKNVYRAFAEPGEGVLSSGSRRTLTWRSGPVLLVEHLDRANLLRARWGCTGLARKADVDAIPADGGVLRALWRR